MTTVAVRKHETMLSVTLEIKPDAKLRIKFSESHSLTVTLLDNPEIHRNSIEAACVSGALYAVRCCGIETGYIIIQSVEGKNLTFDPEGFAVAAALALARALGKEETLPPNMEGWEIADDLNPLSESS